MSDPLDVVMIGPFPEDPSYIKGGVQASVWGLSRALRARPEVGQVIGISIPLAAERGKEVKKVTLGDIEVTYLTAPRRYLASCVLHLPETLRTIKALKNPVVHIHGTGLFQTALCIALRFRRIPFVWTLHGITQKETYQRYRQERSMASAARYSFYTILERMALAFTPDIFVDTPYVEKEIKAGNRVHVLPIGIFTEEFAALRNNPRKEPHILSLGVIDPRKGHHVTLKAFAKLRTVIPDAKLTIAGSLTVPSYFEALKDLAKKLEVHSIVEFAIDYPRSEIVTKLGQARILALHSQEESQGIALCEALAAGLPIVATKVGGIPYVITAGKDGLLTNYGDLPAFTEAMRVLLTDEALWKRMSEAAVVSSSRFDWKTIAAQVIVVYQQAQVSARRPKNTPDPLAHVHHIEDKQP